MKSNKEILKPSEYIKKNVNLITNPSHRIIINFLGLLDKKFIARAEVEKMIDEFREDCLSVEFKSQADINLFNQFFDKFKQTLKGEKV